MVQLLQHLAFCSWPLPPRLFCPAPLPWIAAQAIAEGDAASRRPGGVFTVISIFAEMRAASAGILTAWRWLEIVICFVGGRGELQDEQIALWLPGDDPRRHVLYRVLVPVYHSFPTHNFASGSLGSGSLGSGSLGSGSTRSRSVGSGSSWFDSPIVRHRCCLAAGFSNLRCVVVETRPLDSRKKPLGETTRAGVIVDQPELQALDL